MSVLQVTKKNLPQSEPNHSGDFFKKECKEQPDSYSPLVTTKNYTLEEIIR